MARAIARIKLFSDHMPTDMNTLVLQLNTTGAWRNVVKFDGTKKRKLRAAMAAGKGLADISNGSARIAKDDGHQTAIAHYAAGDSAWRDARTRDMFDSCHVGSST